MLTMSNRHVILLNICRANYSQSKVLLYSSFSGVFKICPSVHSLVLGIRKFPSHMTTYYLMPCISLASYIPVLVHNHASVHSSLLALLSQIQSSLLSMRTSSLVTCWTPPQCLTGVKNQLPYIQHWCETLMAQLPVPLWLHPAFPF